MQESAGGDHVAAHNKAGKPAKSPAAALGEASQASLDDGTMQHTVCVLAKRVPRGTGQSCQKFNTVNPGVHRRSTARWKMRRGRCVTGEEIRLLLRDESESGGEIDLEGSAACDRLRFTGTVGEPMMARQRAKTRLSAPNT